VTKVDFAPMAEVVKEERSNLVLVRIIRRVRVDVSMALHS
jgi:hypothetical protein